MHIKKQSHSTVYKVKETGGIINVYIDRFLADGSRLSSPENAHLLSTIQTIIQKEYPTAPNNVKQLGTSITLLANSLSILVQWMKIRNLHYFSHLTNNDFKNFIYDNSCGLDAVLKSQERLAIVLEAVKNKKLATPNSFSDALMHAGIHNSRGIRLNAAKELFNHFIKTGEIADFIDLKPNKTDSFLWNRANAFRLLWIYRDSIPDGLSFEPSPGDVARLIKTYGHPTKSTRTLPVNYMCNLVGMAFTWVYEYGPALLDVLRSIYNKKISKHQLREAIRYFNTDAIKNGWNIKLNTVRDYQSKGYISWKVAATTLLPSACFIVCGIITARRATELTSLERESLQGNSKTGYWINTYLAKRAKNETFPCSLSVAEAIRTLIKILDIRGLHQSQLIFESINGTGRLSQRLRNGVARFGRLVDSENKEPWDLAPHQFRRIFALIYRWKYDHPSLLALSVHFGHIHPKQINKYTNSIEWKRANLEEGRRFTLTKFREIALDITEPKGINGKSIKKMISRAIAQLELVDESEIDEVLINLIETRGYDLRATPWGYCGAKSSHSNLRRAACTKIDEVRSKALIEPEKSSEDLCAGCLFFSTDKSREAHWNNKLKTLSLSVENSPENSMVKKHCQERMLIIERFSRNNFTSQIDNENPI